MQENKIFWSSIPFFKEYEFRCKCGCEFNCISHKLVEKLNKARFIADVPFVINSACRCRNHNVAVGGSVTSSHLKGFAIDIKVHNDSERFIILNALLTVGFKRLGVYKNFIHCDIDNDKHENVIWYK